MRTDQFERRLRSERIETERRIKEEVSGIIDNNMTEIIKVVTEIVLNYVNIPLTVKQVSHLTGLSTGAIYKMCQRETLKMHKDNGTLFIYLNEITDMLLPSIRKAITTKPN